jgi:Integrase core domain
MDNAMCESFFATVECELLNRRHFKSQIEARMAIFEFIGGCYNPHRRHSALGYRSPTDYEKTFRQNTDYGSPSPSLIRGDSRPPVAETYGAIKTPTPNPQEENHANRIAFVRELLRKKKQLLIDLHASI